MLSDDLPLQVQILVCIVVPPILTVICWLIGRRVAKSSGGGGSQGRTGFWLMLIAAYVIFALALAGAHFLAKRERADPSDLLVQ